MSIQTKWQEHFIHVLYMHNSDNFYISVSVKPFRTSQTKWDVVFDKNTLLLQHVYNQIIFTSWSFFWNWNFQQLLVLSFPLWTFSFLRILYDVGLIDWLGHLQTNLRILYDVGWIDWNISSGSSFTFSFFLHSFIHLFFLHSFIHSYQHQFHYDSTLTFQLKLSFLYFDCLP